MNKSAQMRALAEQGLSTGEIARRLDVRYQFVRNVLVRAGIHSSQVVSSNGSQNVAKPALSQEFLESAGFEASSKWLADRDSLGLAPPVRKNPGVYAFCCGGRAMYVGLATMGLSKRLRFYVRPGPTQSTSIRIKALLLETLQRSPDVHVLTACPPSFEWNGLRVSGAEGLEAALIRDFAIPWNVRGA